jgi:hypothetical protein
MWDKLIFPAPDGNIAHRIPKSLQIYYLAKAGGHNINAYYYDRETTRRLMSPRNSPKCLSTFIEVRPQIIKRPAAVLIMSYIFTLVGDHVKAYKFEKAPVLPCSPISIITPV